MRPELRRLAEAMSVLAKERLLARQVARAERAIAKAFRAQGTDFLKRLAPHKAAFPTAEVIREGTAEDFDPEPLFTQTELATLALFERPIGALAQAALLAGVRVAIADLAADVAFDLEHPRAVAFLRGRAAERVTKINETTREALRALLAQAMEEGWGYDKTAKVIRAEFDGFAGKRPQKHIRSRAHLVAVTECFPGGTLVAPMGLPVATCPFSGESFSMLRRPVGSLLNVAGGGLVSEALESTIVGATRRWYEGSLVSVATACGHQLTGTPNHPVLTDRGWVPLGSLAEGDHVISRGGGEKVGLGHPDVDHMPAEIGQVFDTLKASPASTFERVSGSDMDFHGDGRQGQIDIVWANRELRDKYQAPLFEPATHEVFSVSNLRTSPLPANSPMAKGHICLRNALRAASDFTHAALCRCMGIGQVGAPLLRGASRPSDPTRLGHPPKGHASLFENGANAIVGHAVAASDGLAGFSARVATDSVLSVHWLEFAGHVYNLLTDSGRYIANNIIVHNCGEAYEEGSLQVGKELAGMGLEIEHYWLTVGDSRVSDGCRANEAAGWIPLDQAFPSGHMRPLRFPGCRCTALTRRKPTKEV